MFSNNKDLIFLGITRGFTYDSRAYNLNGKKAEWNVNLPTIETKLICLSTLLVNRTGKGIVNKRTEVPVRSHSSYEEIIKETIKIAWQQFFFVPCSEFRVCYHRLLGPKVKKRISGKGLSALFIKARSRKNCQKAENVHRLLEWCQRKNTAWYTSSVLPACLYKLCVLCSCDHLLQAILRGRTADQMAFGLIAHSVSYGSKLSNLAWFRFWKG